MDAVNEQMKQPARCHDRTGLEHEAESLSRTTNDSECNRSARSKLRCGVRERDDARHFASLAVRRQIEV